MSFGSSFGRVLENNNMKKILVIEDSKILSKIISLQLLNYIDCKVDIMLNADSALTFIEDYPPDLIVLDYRFNQENLIFNNGLEFLKVFREKYKIPVIFFSGQSDREKALEIINAGATAYISKDDDDFMIDLLASVKKVFKLH